jgi:hypothetical protein
MISLTAYRADDDEPWRIERLREVAVRCPRKVIGLPCFYQLRCVLEQPCSVFVEISLPAWACDLQRLLTRDHSHGVSIPPMWELAHYRAEFFVEVCHGPTNGSG